MTKKCEMTEINGGERFCHTFNHVLRKYTLDVFLKSNYGSSDIII